MVKCTICPGGLRVVMAEVEGGVMDRAREVLDDLEMLGAGEMHPRAKPVMP